MAFKKIYAHRLSRIQPQEPATITSPSSPWHLNGQIEELGREMKLSVMKRSGKAYGQFSQDHGAHPLASWLAQYLEEKLSFESFTKKITEQFKAELDKAEVPLDAYLITAHEILEQHELLHVFIVQHETGLYINGDMEIAQSEQLDIHNIRLAAKINISDWQGDDAHLKANAVAILLWRGEKELSDAFNATIGFAEKIDLSAETEAFLNVVDIYTEELPKDIAEKTRAEVVDYCLEQNSMDAPVIFEDLSNKLDSELTQHKDEIENTPPPFVEYLAKSQSVAKPSLIPDKTQIRNYARISGRNALVSMSFASSCLGESIVYDANSDSLTINNLPSSLKSRLKRFVEKSGTN